MSNKSEYKSPLQYLYNIEKTLFPDMEKAKSNIDDFEKILTEIYSEKRKESNLTMKG